MSTYSSLGNKIDICLKNKKERFIRNLLNVSRSVSIKYVAGESNPILVGEKSHYTTIRGKLIRNPNAYRKASFGGKNMVYHKSTQEIHVGTNWSPETKQPVKGYKAAYILNDNICCRGFIFEVGKTYSINEFPELCQKGFHFCEIPKDVLRFYKLNSSFCLLEVEASGVVVHDTIKSVTNKIKILRRIENSEEIASLLNVDYFLIKNTIAC